ncbi:MAG: hypothetical protein PF795_12315, partial [Kiritimatiellae bacterium]|nr:hypothetical protein [Kiritimatiellia bacterium]
PEPGDIIRGEPNVLLLDQPEWRIEDEDAWQPSDDSLMVQLELAKRFGWPDWSQPYTVTDPGRTVTVHRRFRFRTETDLTGLQLVCERASAAEIRLDGQLIDATPSGHWVDRDLPTVDLPPLDRGEHSLEIALALDAVDRHLEWCYLLGSFDVETRGRHAWLVAADNALYWGDVVHQGLPFYGGNLEYELDLTVGEGAEYALRIPNFSGPLLRVWCDERDCGPVAFEPFRCPLGRLGPGPHHVRIRAYGNRCNTFGALHNNRPEYDWFGTRAWRLPDAGRNLVWQFKPAGILRAPLLERML